MLFSYRKSMNNLHSYSACGNSRYMLVLGIHLFSHWLWFAQRDFEGNHEIKKVCRIYTMGGGSRRSMKFCISFSKKYLNEGIVFSPWFWRSWWFDISDAQPPLIKNQWRWWLLKAVGTDRSQDSQMFAWWDKILPVTCGRSSWRGMNGMCSAPTGCCLVGDFKGF